MTEDYKTPAEAPLDWRGLCAEMAGWIERSTRHYIQDPDVLIRARAALAQPEPEVVGPTVMEIIELADEIEAAELGQVVFARAVLARWGRPAPVPVAVSERLPGPEDCDAEGRCWWLHVGEDGVGDWFQRRPYPSTTSYTFFRMTHWLPATALPLPQGEVEHG